jgi:tetrahydromethanopterin S-methyltransferase subunit H
MDNINIYTHNVISTQDWLKNSKKNNKNKHYSWNFINYSKKF